MKKVRTFNYIPTGNVGFEVIQENFATIQKNMDVINEELKLITGRNYADTRMVLVEGTAPVTLLHSRDHNNSKLLSAFIIAADNLKVDQKVRIVNGATDLVEPKTIKATERSGKTQSFRVIERMQVSRYDSIEVLPSSVRKAVIVANFTEVSK